MTYKESNKERWFKYGFILFTLIAYFSFLVIYLNAVYPAIGHDYGYHFPRMLDTLLHFKINGLSIQWFSPSFGGGLPTFSNPQHLQFTLVQFLVFFFTPWVSTVLSSIIFSTLGYWAFYRFSRDFLNISWMASALGATLFTINGFLIEHIAAGHITFQTLPLVSAILYLLFANKMRILTRAILIGGIGTLLLFNGSFYILIIFAFSLAVSISLLLVIKPGIFNFKQMGITSLGGLFSGLLLSGGKLYAVYSFMRFYPRLVSVHYYDTFISSLLGVFYQMLGIMSLVPFYFLRGEETAYIVESLAVVSRFRYIWETDVSFSPVLLLMCFTGLLWLPFNIKILFNQNKSKLPLLGFILLALSLWITFEFITARGISYELLRKLPILSSLRINQRYTIALLLPAAIFGTYSLASILNPIKHKFQRLGMISLTIVSLLFLGSYFMVSPEIQEREFNDLQASEAYQAITAGERYPITHVLDFRDMNDYSREASSLITYEALISNEQQELNTQLTEGDPFEISGGYFNFNNPVGFVYPEESGTQAYERFKIENREMLEAFLNHKQPDWEIPALQLNLNRLSFVTLMLCLAYLFYALANLIKNK